MAAKPSPKRRPKAAAEPKKPPRAKPARARAAKRPLGTAALPMADQYRLIVEGSKDYGFFMLDPAGTVISWNQGAERLKGYQAGEIVGRNFSAFYPADEVAAGKPQRELKEAARAGHLEDEGWRLRKDGSRFWANVVITALRGPDGRLLGFSKLTRDHSARRRAEDLFRGLLESAPDAMVVVDQSGRIVLVNAQTEALFGYKREELVGQGMEMLVPERLRQSHHGHREGYSRDPSPRSMGAGRELNARRKDGSEVPVEISLSPVATESGVLVASAIRDITGRRRLEAELRAANETLQQQNQRVEQANRLKSDFLANMSHELRTPLNSIIGFSEILQDGKGGPITETQKEFLGDVLASAHHLLQLINDILDLAKIEAGKTVFQIGALDLPELLRRSSNALRPQADKRGLRLRLEAAEVPGAQGDTDRLRQVLQNFLSNAIKFSKEHGQVTLRCLDQGASYRLEVEDHGIGINEEDQARLFSDFVQLDAGTDKKYQGTGLGLSLCKKIVEQMGGSVGLRSHPGQGSLFYAELPKQPPASLLNLPQ
jgi:PAS domain S-box-containing protein